MHQLQFVLKNGTPSHVRSLEKLRWDISKVGRVLKSHDIFWHSVRVRHLHPNLQTEILTAI